MLQPVVIQLMFQIRHGKIVYLIFIKYFFSTSSMNSILDDYQFEEAFKNQDEKKSDFDENEKVLSEDEKSEQNDDLEETNNSQSFKKSEKVIS